MSNAPEELLYTESHEWIRNDDEHHVTIGITDHAQSKMGEIVFVDLPEVGEAKSAGDEACVVESVKTAADVYCPIDGTIIEVNEDLANSPNLVNDHPYDDGWIFKVKISDPCTLEGLLTAEKYQENCE